MENYFLNLSASEVHLLYSIVWSECTKFRDLRAVCDLDDSKFIKRLMKLCTKVSSLNVQCNFDENKYEY